jgi:O-antigen/teichoic acid export membrane protein
MPMKHWFNDQHFRSLLKNTSYLAVSKAVAAVAGIATLAFAGRALGLVQFGLLVLIASYAQAASGLTKFQSWQLIIRYGGAALTSGDTATFNRSVGFGLGLDLASGVAGMAAAIALLPLIGPWTGLTAGLIPIAMAYCLLVPTMGAAAPVGALRALDRFDLLSWQGTITPIARAALAGVGWWQGWSLPAFVAIWFATDLLGDLFLWFLAGRELRRKRMLKGVRPSLSAHGLPGAWPFAIQVNVHSSLMSAWGPVARVIIGGLLGPASAALYRVASSLADSAQKPADLLAKAYYPEVVRMDFASKHPWRLMLRGTAMASAFGLAAVLAILLAGQWLLATLFGPEFVPAYPVLLVLIGIPLLWMLGFPLTPMLYALDRPDAPLKARAIGTVVYLAIIAPLCWRFEVAGAASALLIGNLIIVALMMVQLRIQYRRVRGP